MNNRNKIKALLLATLLLITNAVSNEIVVDEDRLPSISNKKLNEIINSDAKFYLEDLEVQERNNMQKNSIGATRKTFAFDNILKNIERQHREYGSLKDIIYLSKDRGLKIYLTSEQYKSLLNTINLDDFLLKFNKYSNMNFSRHALSDMSNEEIIYIGNYANAILNDTPTVDYVLLSRKGNSFHSDTFAGKGCSSFNQAFLYFKNYNGQTNRSVNFNLSAIQIMDLYIKLYKWNIDVSKFNNVLLKMFKKKSQYINNFNFEQAFSDLRRNPSYEVAQNIKDDISKIYQEYSDDSVSVEKREFLFDTPMPISKLLSEVSLIEGSNYYLYDRYCHDILINVLISNDVMLYSFSDLQQYLLQATKYSIKVIENKYILSADKKIIIFPQRDKIHQALHFLNASIKEVIKSENNSFSEKAFIDDINEIKKGYL